MNAFPQQNTDGLSINAPKMTSNDPELLILIDLSVRIRHSMCPLSDCIEPATTVTFE